MKLRLATLLVFILVVIGTVHAGPHSFFINTTGQPTRSSENYSRMTRSGPKSNTTAAASADLDRIVAWGLASDRATVTKAMREMYTTDSRSPKAAISVPTLGFSTWIGHSPYPNHDLAARLYSEQYAQLPGVKIQISDTARHFVVFDVPDWLCSTVRTFLNDKSNASR